MPDDYLLEAKRVLGAFGGAFYGNRTISAFMHLSHCSIAEPSYNGRDFLLTSECPRGHPYYVGEVSSMFCMQLCCIV